MITLAQRLKLAAEDFRNVKGYLLLAMLLEEAAQTIDKALSEIPKCGRSEVETGAETSGVPHSWVEWRRDIGSRLDNLETRVKELEGKVYIHLTASHSSGKPPAPFGDGP